MEMKTFTLSQLIGIKNRMTTFEEEEMYRNGRMFEIVCNNNRTLMGWTDEPSVLTILAEASRSYNARSLSVSKAPVDRPNNVSIIEINDVDWAVDYIYKNN